jgi:hypothetical protein
MISRSQMNRQLYQMGGEGMQESQRDAQLSEQLQIEKAYRELVRRGLTEDEARQSIILQLSELKRMDNMPYAPSEDKDMYKNMPYAPSEDEDMYKNMPYAPSENEDMYKQEPNLLQPGEYAGENYKGSPDMYPDYEIDFQENNNRQMRQMGGMGMQPMQQMDAEQYRPIAEQLAQDPNQALMTIVKMLMEQGIPEEEAIKIAQQMIQSVAEGGMEEVSDDTRIEARFGGRIGYANGGIGTLVDREQYGFGSFVKSVKKGVTGAVKGVTNAVKSVAKSPIGRIALTVAAGYYLGPMVSGFSSNPFVQGALRGGLANLAVQAVSGQKINFGEALTSAALGGVTQGLTQGQTGGATKFAPDPFQEAALGNPTVSAFEPSAFAPDPFQAAAAPAADTYANIAGGAADIGGEAAYTSAFDYQNTPSLFDTSAQASITGGPGITFEADPFQASAGASVPTSDFSDYFNSFEDIKSPTYQQGKFGQTIGVEVGNEGVVYKPGQVGFAETPLSQRYETGIQALKDYRPMDALKQVSGAAMDYPLTTIGGISTLASAMTPEIPEQLPGESMEEYRARVAEFERQYASNLSGRTGPSLPASANNPFYPVYAARGGRIGYLFGGSGVASAVAQPVEGQSMPVSGGGKGIGGMLRNLIANNPEIFRQVTSEQTMSPMQRSSGPIPLGLVNYSGTPYENAIKKTSVAQPTVGGSTYSSGGGFGGLGVGSNLIKQITQQSFFNTNEDEEDTRYKLPASARNPFYGVMMANGGRMRYAMGNSVQQGIMVAPQIARQMGMPVGNPRMNEGGVPELDYRDEGGFVPPIGIKERADDIPAMLSNNEFVFTADAVKNAGGGDPNVGAQKMYTLMKRLESGGRV